MDDPLIVAANVIDLLSLGIQTLEYLQSYFTVHRNQNADLAKTVERLSSLVQTLQGIDGILKERNWRPDEWTTLKDIEISILDCEDVVNELQDLAQRLRNGLGTGRQAAYPFRVSTLLKLDEDIIEVHNSLSMVTQTFQLGSNNNAQDQKEAVSATLERRYQLEPRHNSPQSVININDDARVHIGDTFIGNDTREIGTLIKTAQAHQLAADLRKWLRAPDATVDYNNASQKRHAGTGQWLTEASSFTTWLQQANSFLWLYGFAGCGKSVLCSTAIQAAFRHRQSSLNSAVAFFFFTFSNESKQNASAALRALLLQLCGQISDLEAKLLHLKELHEHSTPPVPTLLQFLREGLSQCSHVYIFLDALDESPADSLRAEVLSTIEIIRRWQLPNLHLLVTSRDLPDIRDHLVSPKQDLAGTYIVLKNDEVKQDIAQYVSFQVDHDLQLQGWGDNRHKIKSYLTQHADGVFRWVECQLRPLRQCPRSEKHLERCLHSLPRNLDETYERILCSLEAPEEARQVLSLLSHASRPLSVDEVIEALAVDLDDLECYDPRSRLIGGTDDLHRICPGLIETNFTVNQSRYKRSYSRRSEWVVRIAHSSVRDYLLSDRIKTSRAHEFALAGPTQHGRITKTCLLYLSCKEFLQQSLTVDLVEKYAFAAYAAENWYLHYRQADSQLAGQLLGNIVALLTENHALERWIRLHNPDQPWENRIKFRKVYKQHPSPKYFASLLGLSSVLAYFLSTSIDDADVPLGGHRTPSQVTGVKGHKATVKILSNNEVDANDQEGRYGFPLAAASARGHDLIVQMLLSKGVNVNSRGGFFGTALQAASYSGHKSIVQELIYHGADIDAHGGFYGTALIAAIDQNHKEITQILLDHNANPNTGGVFYRTALQLAAQKNDVELMLLLLDKEADVNLQDNNYDSPLQTASIYGHEDIVNILLRHTADVNAGGGFQGSALQCASSNGHSKIVKMLFKAGAHVNTEGGEYGCPLQAASIEGYEHIVQMLIDAGADVNSQGGRYGNALQAASGFGREQIVQVLLDAGANVNAQGGYYCTALEAASHRGNEQVVKMLINAGADVNVQGGVYGNALRAAKMRSKERIAQILIDAGAFDIGLVAAMPTREFKRVGFQTN